MRKLLLPLFLALLITGCNPPSDPGPDQDMLARLGGSVKESFEESARYLRTLVAGEPTNVDALAGLAESEVILYIFGYLPREETLPSAREAFGALWRLDSLSSRALKLKGIFSFLDWEWSGAEEAFLRAIEADPANLNARHWYALYLSAMGRFEEAMAQSDSIVPLDPQGDYMIGRGSLLYFARRNNEMRDLMLKAVARDSSVAWGYDWLGMAYAELGDFENSIRTYYRAFELSEGTVEVGAGLGHALGLAGEYRAAKKMADYYAAASETRYIPPVQRAFIHIGIEEYDEAIRLLEQAYGEKSWFLIFMNVEPWYDPIREDGRFGEIVRQMDY